MKGNSLIDIITSRKSVRKWTDKKINEQQIKKLLSCGLSSPSAYNASPWEFIVVTSTEFIVKLLSDRYQMKKKPYYINSKREAIHSGIDNYEKVCTPPLLIVGCGNLQKCDDVTSVIQSVSCACENILLAAHSQKLGACWLYVYDPSTPQTELTVKQILNIPKHIVVLSLLVIGYPAEESSRKFVFVESKIHQNKY